MQLRLNMDITAWKSQFLIQHTCATCLTFSTAVQTERTQMNNISQCKSVHLCVQFTASLQHQEESETRMNAYLNHVG